MQAQPGRNDAFYQTDIDLSARTAGEAFNKFQSGRRLTPLKGRTKHG